MFLTGDNGCVQLRRRTELTLTSQIRPEDVNSALHRFSADQAELNFIRGDRLEISTTDPRGLVFIDPSFWADGVVHHNALLYANVNAVGGIRGYRTFEEAVNGDPAGAVPLLDFDGAPLTLTFDVRDTQFTPLGGVSRFTFNTDRAAVDATALGDLFAEQYSAGNITGSGTIDCFFEADRQRCERNGVTQTPELSMVLAQVILRTELGSQFDAVLQLYGGEKPVYYEVTAVTTRTGVTVGGGGVVELAVDFVTTGEFALRIGDIGAHILKEDYDRITKEQDLDFLLMEPTD
jgi:hypothetical protein